jgi:hypothetical protein
MCPVLLLCNRIAHFLYIVVALDIETIELVVCPCMVAVTCCIHT